jgi:peptidoglycan-N-acetylglucosamine deacetylase
MNILLTFDDGPGPSTEKLLDVLKSHDILATFCVLGRNVEKPGWPGATQDRSRGLAIRAAREGHELASHTFLHLKAYDSEESFREDFANGRAVVENLRRLAGVDEGRPMRFRLPYGPQPDDRRPAYLQRIAVPDFHGTALFNDWEASASGPEMATRMVRHVEDFIAQDRDVVLILHDSSEAPEGASREQSVIAADLFLKEVEKRAWRRHFGEPRRPVRISPLHLNSGLPLVQV